MAYATGSRFSLAYGSETVFGTAAASMRYLRVTGTSLGLSKDQFVSNELRSDRQVADVRFGNRKVQGDVRFELSYGALDDLLAGVFMGDWATDVLVPGVAPKSFTLEKRFEDVGSYQLFTGCMASSLSLSVAPGAIVTGALSMVGRDMSESSSGTTPAAATSAAPMDSYTGSVSIGGAESGVVTGLDITLDNGLNPAYVVGENTAQAVIPGRSNATGSLSVYFEDATLLGNFLAEDDVALACTLGDGTNTYTLALPKVNFTGADLPVNGEGAVSLNLPFQAVYDSVTGANLKITRA